jgi:hypothetical protein
MSPDGTEILLTAKQVLDVAAEWRASVQVRLNPRAQVVLSRGGSNNQSGRSGVPASPEGRDYVNPGH